MCSLGQSWMECGDSHPFMSCSSREPTVASLFVGCVWHSAIRRGGLALGLPHFSERKNLKILWPQLFCYVCKQSGKWGQDINTSQMRTGKSLQAKAVCHAWKHRLRCQRQAVMGKLFQPLSADSSLALLGIQGRLPCTLEEGWVPAAGRTLTTGVYLGIVGPLVLHYSLDWITCVAKRMNSVMWMSLSAWPSAFGFVSNSINSLPFSFCL